MIWNPLGALPACSGGGILGFSDACCPGSSATDSDELVLVEPGRDDSLFASEPASSVAALARPESLLARFVDGESLAKVVGAVEGDSCGSVMLTVGVVSMASGESVAWFATDETGMSLFRLAVLPEADNEGEDISRLWNIL